MNRDLLFGLTELASRVAEVLGVEQQKVCAAGKQREIVKTRSLLCYWEYEGETKPAADEYGPGFFRKGKRTNRGNRNIPLA